MKIKKLFIGFIFFASIKAFSEPTGGPLFIKLLRVYSSGEIYVTMQNNTFCTTDTFHVPATFPGRREILATLLTAKSLDSPVYLEALNDTGCVGWGTKLQSVYLISQ